MKILQIAFSTMDIGGVQKEIIDFAESMPDYHFDVVVFSSEEGRLEKRFRELGGNETYIGLLSTQEIIVLENFQSCLLKNSEYFLELIRF